jgi:hypothetical protein
MMLCCTISSNRSQLHLYDFPSFVSSVLQTQGDAWFKPSAENIHAGVCLRIQTGQYRVFPYENRFLEPFEAAVRVLNPVVAVKVRSAAVHVALSTVYVPTSRAPHPVVMLTLHRRDDDATAIYVDDDTRIQILDSMPDLPRADKEQCGAVIVSFLARGYLYVHSLAYSGTSAYWLSGQTTWMASFPCVVTLRTTSSSLFGLTGTRLQVLLQGRVSLRPPRSLLRSTQP